MAYESGKNGQMIIDRTSGRRIIRRNVKNLSRNPKLIKLLLEKEIFCVTRDSNIDGIGAPALLLHNYGMKEDNIIFTNYSNFKSLFGTIKRTDTRNAVFVFSDLGMSDVNANYSSKVLKLLKSRGTKVIWLDHHPWPDEMVKRMENYFDFAVLQESRKYCATEIVYNLLCNKDATSKKIASLAHYADFVIKSKYDKTLRKLSYSIVYALYSNNRIETLKKLTKLFSKLEIENKMINRTYNFYMRRETKNKRNMLGNSYTIKAGKYKIGIAFGKGIQTNSACAAIHDKLKSDINIYVNTDTGKCGIRSENHVDSADISRTLGGGGHPQASAFNIKPSRFKNNSKRAMKKFVERIDRISQRLYS